MGSPTTDVGTFGSGGNSVVSAGGSTTYTTNAVNSTAPANLVLVAVNAQYDSFTGAPLAIQSITGGGLTFVPLVQRYVNQAVTGQFSSTQWLMMEVWWAWAPTALVSATYTVTVNNTQSILLSVVCVKNAYSATGWPDPNPATPVSGFNTTGMCSVNYATSFADDLVLFYTASAGFSATSPTGSTAIVQWAGAGSINVSTISENAPVSSSASMGDSNNTARGSIGIIIAVTGDTGQADAGSLSDSSSALAATSASETESGTLASAQTAIAARLASLNEAGEVGIFVESADAVVSNNPFPFSVPVSHRLLAFDVNSVLSYLAGPNLEALIITPEIEPTEDLQKNDRTVMQGDRTRITSSKVSIEGNYDATKIPTITLRYRDQQEEPTTDGPAVALNDWDEAPQRLDTRYVRCLIDIPAGATWRHVEDVELVLGKSTRR